MELGQFIKKFVTYSQDPVNAISRSNSNAMINIGYDMYVTHKINYSQ